MQRGDAASAGASTFSAAWLGYSGIGVQWARGSIMDEVPLVVPVPNTKRGSQVFTKEYFHNPFSVSRSGWRARMESYSKTICWSHASIVCIELESRVGSGRLTEPCVFGRFWARLHRDKPEAKKKIIQGCKGVCS